MNEYYEEYNDYEETDDFDEWEDVELSKEEENELNFEINNTPLETKQSKQLLLSKLTKKFKQDYINQSVGTHCLQAAFSAYNFNLCFLTNINPDIKLKSFVPGVIRKKFKTIDCENEKLVFTLVKGFTLWFEKNYKIDIHGERPMHATDLKNKCFVRWFEQHDNQLKDILTDNKSYYNNLKREHKISKHMAYKPDFKHLKLLIDPKETDSNTKQMYVMKYYIILRELCKKANLKIKLIYNVPCLDINKAINDCSTKTFLKIIQEQKYSQEEGSVEIKRSVDYDLFYPYLWLELELPNGNLFYLNPVIHGNMNNYYEKIDQNKPFYPFYKFGSISPHALETPFYVLSVDETLQFQDISRRYIPNLQYTKRPCLINLKKEIFWLINKSVWKSITMIFEGFDIIPFHYDDHPSIVEYMELPETSIKALKKHPNFVVKGFSNIRNSLETLEGVAYKKLNINTKTYLVYLRSQLVRTRSSTHWEIIGRSVKKEASPITTKRYLDKNDEYKVASLYTFDQTFKTPRIPSLKSIKAYRRTLRGTEMLKIFNQTTMLPKTYCLLKEGKVNKKLLNKFNKKNRRVGIDYMDVITGFKFLKKNQIKPVTSVMVHEVDFEKLKEFEKYQDEVDVLKKWQELLLRLDIKQRIHTQGF